MSIGSRNEAQLVSFFKTVIYNTATNYYKKKIRYQENECPLDPFERDLSIGKNNFSCCLPVIILDSSIVFDDEIVEKTFRKLNLREKRLLTEKFVYDKTDREIGETLGISRQGVTNLKHRVFNKFREESGKI